MSSTKHQYIDGEGSTFHVKKTFDTTPTMESAAALRSAGATTMGDSWHVGRIDARLLSKWVKDAGLKMSDSQAVADLIKKKLLDGDFKNFRVHEGTF